MRLLDFKKRPVVVQAIRIDADNYDEMCEIVAWCGAEAVDYDGHVMRIPTLEGWLYANPGDWIIKGVEGEFHACKPLIFEKTYEPA